MPRVTTKGLKESLELINISVLIYHMQIMEHGVHDRTPQRKLLRE